MGLVLEFPDLNHLEEGGEDEALALGSQLGSQLNGKMRTWVISDLAFLTAFLAVRPLMRYLIWMKIG